MTEEQIIKSEDIMLGESSNVSGAYFFAALGAINYGLSNDIFDDNVKSASQLLVSNGCENIPIQCLANGNLEHPEDVLHIVKKLLKGGTEL